MCKTLQKIAAVQNRQQALRSKAFSVICSEWFHLAVALRPGLVIYGLYDLWLGPTGGQSRGLSCFDIPPCFDSRGILLRQVESFLISKGIVDITSVIFTTRDSESDGSINKRQRGNRNTWLIH